MARFVYKKQYIGQLELLGALCVYTTWPDIFRDRQVIHFIDNTSALSALIRGYSSLPDSARIVYAYHSILFWLRASVWNEFVCSEANCGDAPTRLNKPEMVHLLQVTLKAKLLRLKMPLIDAWNAAFSHWAAFKI